MKIRTQKPPGAEERATSLSSKNRRRWRDLLALCSTAALALGFCVLPACSSSNVDYAVPPGAASAVPRSTLAVGDVVRVSYPGAPELNQTVKVQPDGKVGLPMVGNVTARGRSASALQSSLTAMYKPHLNDPTVFVSLEQPAASVYVSGEVASPGKVPLDRSVTALEAVMEVGGFSRLANPRKVYVIRTEGGKQRRFVLNLAAPLGGHESPAFYLRPYDVVYVERSNW